MKKLVLSMMTIGAMFFATQNLQAQEEDEEIEEIEMEIEQKADEFVSVDVISLPQTVKDAVTTDYNQAVATEAWMKTKGETKVYKLKLDVEGGESEEVYIDQDGKWLEKEGSEEDKQ